METFDEVMNDQLRDRYSNHWATLPNITNIKLLFCGEGYAWGNKVL